MQLVLKYNNYYEFYLFLLPEIDMRMTCNCKIEYSLYLFLCYDGNSNYDFFLILLIFALLLYIKSGKTTLIYLINPTSDIIVDVEKFLT